ncbi:hypothetical protein A1Q2_07423 [Trichosporon asahii var. asahii CBS 8904]|uniref:Prefoldin subunit 4 n=1 Tax=Trichosporon asahii var. asahii (strain CBS 8904) TaxID=1220162 RepID=K1V392_TRIAC|nr:hypothetical protein A1Q2_07423 [Trichosporon asahii var. asahii CBS 8904]
MSLVNEADGIEVAWEDQQKINTFSKLNNRLGDLRDQLKVKEDEKEYYDDLQMELELSDAKTIMYKIGEAFFDLPLPTAKKQLRTDLKRYDGEISELKERCDECEHGMQDLKVQLADPRYAKFGKQINLETGPD